MYTIAVVARALLRALRQHMNEEEILEFLRKAAESVAHGLHHPMVEVVKEHFKDAWEWIEQHWPALVEKMLTLLGGDE